MTLRKIVTTLICAILIALMQVIGWTFATARQEGSIVPVRLSVPVFIGAVLVVAAIVAILLFLLYTRWDTTRGERKTRNRKTRLTMQIPRGTTSSLQNEEQEEKRDDIKEENSESYNAAGKTSRLREMFASHRAPIILALVLLVCWLPYLIVFFPGSFPWDGVRSMNQFITDAPLENHHPVVMNLLYAGCMSLGRVFGSDNLGVFFVVAFQSIVCAVAFSLVMVESARLGAPRWLLVVSLIFFIVSPIWGTYAQAAIKDTLFNGVFCLFVIAVIRVLTPVRRSRKSWVFLFVMSLIMCFVRNNGIYLVAPTLLFLAIALWREARRGEIAPSSDNEISQHARHAKEAPSRKMLSVRSLLRRIVISLVAVLVVYIGATRVLFPAAGIDMSEDKEMLSIPFQQTARYVTLLPDEVTDEEREAIDAVLPYDELADLYIPDLSDTVKESVRDEDGGLGDGAADYFSAWLSMGLKHPGVYLDATLANTWAYFYPWVLIGEDIDRPIFQLYIQGEPINTSFDVYYVMPEDVRTGVEDTLQATLDIPILNLMYSPATYILAFMVVFFFGLRKRGCALSLIVVALPVLMLLLTTLAGPLNGHLRYMLPLAAALPLIYGWILGNNGLLHIREQHNALSEI